MSISFQIFWIIPILVQSSNFSGNHSFNATKLMGGENIMTLQNHNPNDNESYDVEEYIANQNIIVLILAPILPTIINVIFCVACYKCYKCYKTAMPSRAIRIHSISIDSTQEIEQDIINKNPYHYL